MSPTSPTLTLSPANGMYQNQAFLPAACRIVVSSAVSGPVRSRALEMPPNGYFSQLGVQHA